MEKMECEHAGEDVRADDRVRLTRAKALELRQSVR